MDISGSTSIRGYTAEIAQTVASAEIIAVKLVECFISMQIPITRMTRIFTVPMAPGTFPRRISVTDCDGTDPSFMEYSTERANVPVYSENMGITSPALG